MIDFLVNWAANVPAFAVPFALAALGLIVTEKAGVLSLGAEGYLLMGALAAAGAFVAIGDHALLAVAVGTLATAAFSLVFALMAVTLRVNQVVAGLIMVFLAQGLTGLIGTQQGWTNQPIAGFNRVALGPLADIPALGSILFQQDMLVYLTLPIFFAVAYLLSRTMTGLRLRAVGDAPEAADAAGANVTIYRYGAILAGSAIVGLAGAYLSVGVAKMWVEGMSGGRGWIAVALVIFARWQPWRAFAGAVLFGGIEASIPRIAAVGLQVPQYFMLMAPYIATLAVMVYTNLNKNAERSFDEPRGLGQPYLREERR